MIRPALRKRNLLIKNTTTGCSYEAWPLGIFTLLLGKIAE